MADLSESGPFQDSALGMCIAMPDVVSKTGVQFYKGATVFADPADSMLGKTSPAGYPMLIAKGVMVADQKGDGARPLVMRSGPIARKNSASTDAIPTTLPLGWPVYAPDNQAVSLTNGGGTRPLLGHHGGFTPDGLPIVWIGFCPYPLHELVIPFAKGHADLDAAATSQDFTLYTLPGPARVLAAPTIDSLTVFTGGSASAVTVAIGADSDPDAIGDEKSIFTGGSAGAMTAGVLGYAGALHAAGTAIKAQFVADVNVVALSAGAVAGALRVRPGS